MNNNGHGKIGSNFWEGESTLSVPTDRQDPRTPPSDVLSQNGHGRGGGGGGTIIEHFVRVHMARTDMHRNGKVTLQAVLLFLAECFRRLILRIQVPGVPAAQSTKRNARQKGWMAHQLHSGHPQFQQQTAFSIALALEKASPAQGHVQEGKS